MQNKYIITYEIDRKYTISLGRVPLYVKKIRINCRWETSCGQCLQTFCKEQFNARLAEGMSANVDHQPHGGVPVLCRLAHGATSVVHGDKIDTLTL